MQRIVLALGLVLLLGSCQGPALGPLAHSSPFTVIIGSGQRLIAPQSLSIFSYKLTGTGPSGATTSASAVQGAFTFDALAVGSWTFQVSALDATGGQVAAGAVTTIVGSDTSATIYLSPTATGSGTLAISLSWPYQTQLIDTVTGTLVPLQGGSPTPIALTMNPSNGTASYTGTLNTGSYAVMLKGTYNGVVVTGTKMETAVVFKGLTTSWSVSFYGSSSSTPDFVSGTKAITAFGFPSPLATGTIKDDNPLFSIPSISLTVPLDADLTSVAPTFTLSPGAVARVGAATQTSGTSVNNFSVPVTYSVVAPDQTTAGYRVFVDRWKKNSSLTGISSVSDIKVVGSTVYAATPNGLGISTDGGSTWTVSTSSSGLGSTKVNTVAVVNSTIYAGTDGGLSRSTNGGATWTNITWPTFGSTVTSGTPYSVFSVAVSGNLIVAGGDCGILVSQDAGVTWKNYRNTSTSWANAWGVTIQGSKVYVGTMDGLFVSSDGASTWSRLFTNGDRTKNDVVYGTAVSGSSIYAATLHGVAISKDGGATWTGTTANGLGGPVVSSIVLSGTVLYAITQSSSLMPTGLSVSADGGLHWANYLVMNTPLALSTTVPAPTYRAPTCVWASGTSVYVGADTLYSSTVSGVWQTSAPSAPTGLTVVKPAGSYALQITWEGSARATGYNIYWSTKSSGVKATGSSMSPFVPFYSYMLTTGTTYYFTVTAYNTAGESVESTAVAYTN